MSPEEAVRLILAEQSVACATITVEDGEVVGLLIDYTEEVVEQVPHRVRQLTRAEWIEP